jgi:hypothetical protein
MTGDLLEKGKLGTDRDTGTPAANKASRKKGNTAGSQRGGRESERAAGLYGKTAKPSQFARERYPVVGTGQRQAAFDAN